MNGTYKVGETVLENWKIERLIGEGSFGKVYEITREDFGVTYKSALKVISVPQRQSEIAAAREEGMDEKSTKEYFYSVVEEIVKEFALMSKLKGVSNIVSYEDHKIIPHDKGIGWDILIRMELLTPLLTYAYTVKSFARKDIIKLGIDMCNALELCQKYNIIHRDIKPENIFVSENGDFKIGDFGIARTMEGNLSELSKKGTYSYMAPEVYKGEKYGFSVDMYSLGIVLYRLLNKNRTPFLPVDKKTITYSEKMMALEKRMRGDDIPLPFYGEGRLAEIVLKACAYLPGDRYSSPMQMKQELEAIYYDTVDASIIYPTGDVLSIKEEYAASNGIQEDLDFTDTMIDDAQTVLMEEEPSDFVVKKPKQRGKKKKWIILLAVILCLGVGAVTFLNYTIGQKYDELLNQAKDLGYKSEEVLTVLQEAQKIKPKQAEAFVRYAYTLHNLGRYEDCVTYIEDTLAMGKAFDTKYQNQLSEILASAYFEKGDYAAAASFFRFTTAGGDITVSAMRDYAVCLGRLGDYDAADEVLERMIEAGAEGEVTQYVVAEVDFAQKHYRAAEEELNKILEKTSDADLRKRALRTLAELYRECSALEKTNSSPIKNAAQKEAELLNTKLTEYALGYDTTLREMLAMAYFEAYENDNSLGKEWLENSAEEFNELLERGVVKDYIFSNLFTIYYKLPDYDKAEKALQEYQDYDPNSYTPHALRAMMMITVEGNKPQDERDYNGAYEEYETAKGLAVNSDDTTYLQQVESLIEELKRKDWL